MLSKKDVVSINHEFDAGTIVNESSLDYVVNTTRKSNNWLKTAALFVRAILVDHVFADGNKRTAAVVIMTYLDINGFDYDADFVAKTVVKIIKQNITDIRKIERLIRNVVK